MEDLASLRLSIKDIWWQQCLQRQEAETFVTCVVVVILTACASCVELFFPVATLIQKREIPMESCPSENSAAATITIMNGLGLEGVTTALE